MRIVRTAQELVPFHGCVVVPTMGALHEGHAALVRAARGIGAETGAPVVVTVFVNPTQFNDAKDFETYPRNEEHDAALCARWGADGVFAPDVREVYPDGLTPHGPIDLPAIATEPSLEDRWRPGHFQGVVRVCRRLFDLTHPSAALFGEKDWQQLQLIRAMVQADARPIRIVPCPTVREADGVALSSRNTRLTPPERAIAAAIPRALEAAGAHEDPTSAEAAGLGVLAKAGITPEYLVVRDGETLTEWRPGRPGRVVVACRVGGTRLIDNAPWPGWRFEA